MVLAVAEVLLGQQRLLREFAGRVVEEQRVGKPAVVSSSGVVPVGDVDFVDVGASAPHLKLDGQPILDDVRPCV